MRFSSAHQRAFHPLFWWVWAALISSLVLVENSASISIAAAISSSLIVFWFRKPTYWHATYFWALRFAAIAFSIRIFIGIAIGVPMPGRVLFTLPQLTLPDFLVGIRLGGVVTSQRLETAFREATLLVALILIFAAANSLSNPHALLRVLPKRFYGIGLAGVIATSVAPQSAKSISRVRAAKRLRGQEVNTLSAWRGVALPVLEDALERSIDLAAALESRGYGLQKTPSRYRPEKWRSTEFLALSGPVYLIVAFLLVPQISQLFLALGVLILSLTPAVNS